MCGKLPQSWVAFMMASNVACLWHQGPNVCIFTLTLCRLLPHILPPLYVCFNVKSIDKNNNNCNQANMLFLHACFWYFQRVFSKATSRRRRRKRRGRKHGTNHLLFTFHILLWGRVWQILTTKVAIIAVAAAPWLMICIGRPLIDWNYGERCVEWLKIESIKVSTFWDWK